MASNKNPFKMTEYQIKKIFYPAILIPTKSLMLPLFLPSSKTFSTLLTMLLTEFLGYMYMLLLCTHSFIRILFSSYFLLLLLFYFYKIWSSTSSPKAGIKLNMLWYQNMEQKCEKQGLNHALTEARTSEAAKLQNRVNG